MRTEAHEAVFQRWLSQHLGLMLKVVRACAADPQDQDDVFQDVLVNLWSSIPHFRGEAQETTWIYRVAFNTSQVWQRSEQRRRRNHQAFVSFAATLHSRPLNIAADPKLELIEKLHATIRLLPKVDAALAIMHLDGVSYRQMAEVLGISENYIGVKLNRIRKFLADQLEGAFDEL